MHLTAFQWTLLAAGAFFTGLSKTGVTGLGVLSVALFANALPARVSTGALLPLLLCADLFGVSFYRKHVQWPLLLKLFPWVGLGVVTGYFALGKISDPQAKKIIGGILLLMIALHLWRRRQPDQNSNSPPHSFWFGAVTGILAGFTTMLANAAGPVMNIYFLAVGLPKLAFVGTTAWFFMLVNAFKVPFSALLGLISLDSLLVDALLILPMIPGALLGPVILRRIPQRGFELLVLLLTIGAALRLLVW